MDETGSGERDDVVSKGNKEEHEQHDVHAEGKVCDKNSKCSNNSPELEHKSLEPGGDAIENGNLEDNLQYDKSVGKNERVLSNHNTWTDESISDNFTKNENVMKHQKAEQYPGFASLPKNIGDRKQVKFIMKDGPKLSGGKVHQAKERGRNVNTAGKGGEVKSQFPSGKENSPQSDKQKERNKAICKKRDIPKKEETPKHEHAKKSDDEDSGEEYWSKSTGESAIKLETENDARDSAKVSEKLCSKSTRRAGVGKRGLQRSASAENKKSMASALNEGKQDLLEDLKSGKTSHVIDTLLETSPRDISFTTDKADTEGSESDEEGCTYDGGIGTDIVMIDIGNEDIAKADDILAENLTLPITDGLREECEIPASSATSESVAVEPVPNASVIPCVTRPPADASSTLTPTTGPSTSNGAHPAAFSWSEWYGQLLEAYTSASYYRVSLCLGWLLWAAWIMRLMGLGAGVGGLASALGSWGLMEFVGVVEVIGLLQVMWMLRRPPQPPPLPPVLASALPLVVPAPSDPAPAPGPVPKVILGAPVVQTGNASATPQDIDLEPTKNSSERAIADILL